MPSRPHRPPPRLAAPSALVALTLAAAASLAPGPAAAQAPADPNMSSVPGADAFDIRYYVTDEDGNRLRAMAATDFLQFVNQARCECGHQIETQIRLKSTSGMTYDNTKLLQTFVGTNCGTAEANPVGQFRRCAMLKSSTAPDYVQGLNTTFHPVWLTNGVAIESGDIRDPRQAIAAGSCVGGQGESGVWMCAQTNAQSGCQSDEFFISGTQNSNLPAGTTGGIKFDFLPPVTEPENIRASAGDSAVVVSWDVQPGDINGFRVLCEEVETGNPPPNKGMAAPALDKIPNGTIYYTKGNLCPNGPFSTFKAGSNTPIDDSGTTTDDSAGTTDATATDATATDATTTDATGGTGGTTTGDTTTTGTTTDATAGTTTEIPVPPNCGDNVLQTDEGEQCDNGNLNSDDSDTEPCHLNCQLNVCGDGKPGPDEVCDNGADNGPDGLCSADCSLNVSQGMIDLDWSYVCSGHLAYNTKSVRIEGLENDKEYNFLLVAYDKSGNPLPSKQVIRAKPVDTQDLWEECHERGDVCGTSGFCNVSERGDPLLGLGALLGLGLGLGGLLRRRTRTTHA